MFLAELSDGHYWVNDPGLLFDKPTKLIGDERNPANVVVEMSGSVQWKSAYGWIEGVSFRRPKISTGEPPSYPMLEVTGDGKVDLFHCVFDNEGSTGSVVMLSGSGQKGKWREAVIRNGGSCGIEMQGEIEFQLTEVCVGCQNLKQTSCCAVSKRCSLFNHSVPSVATKVTVCSAKTKLSLVLLSVKWLRMEDTP